MVSDGAVRMASGTTSAEARARVDAEIRARHEGKESATRRRRPRLQAEFRTVEQTLPPGAALTIDAAGPVTVKRSTDELLRAETEIAAGARERTEASLFVLESDPAAPDAFVLRVAFPEPPQPSDFASFEVEVPASLGGIRVRTRQAPVTLTDVPGPATVQTTMASVRVERQGGAVAVSTTNGAVTVISPGGAVEARTVNSPVVVREAPASVDATTDNAAVDVTLTADAPGPVAIVTTRAGVLLRLGRAFAGELSAEAPGGRVDAPPAMLEAAGIPASAVGPSSLRLRLGSAAQTARIATTGGTITILRDDAADPKPDRP